MLRVPNPAPGVSTDAGTATRGSSTAGVVARGDSVTDVLRSASTAAYGYLMDHAVDPDRTSGWTTVAALHNQPERLGELADTTGRDRFCTPDRSLALAQVVRESTATLACAAAYTWSSRRRLLDLNAANVAIHDGPAAILTALRTANLAVLPDDPLAQWAGLGTGGSIGNVEVVDEATMFSRLLDDVIGRRLPQPRNGSSNELTTPPATAPTAAIATIIATIRQLETTGDRHLWGSVALAVASGLTKASHVVGERADQDRAAIFAARPDLAGLVELTTVPDSRGDPLTFAIRRTCCLLYKLPQGTQCATCSLRERDEQVTELTSWHVLARGAMTADPGPVGAGADASSVG